MTETIKSFDVDHLLVNIYASEVEMAENVAKITHQYLQ
ncbi:MAG: Glucosamine-6-phosphate deaminase 1, partial [Cyanobacteriota bacterium]